MALIEVYCYPFNGKFVNTIHVVKYYRYINNTGLNEAVQEINKIRFDTRDSSNYIIKNTELLFYSGNDITKGIAVSRELELMNCKYEILYNGNMRTLELLYGK